MLARCGRIIVSNAQPAAQNTPTPENDTTVDTTYSPDGKYLIEGFGENYEEQFSGENVIKQLRIVDADKRDTVWHMDGSFLLTAKPFTWTTDSKYVYIGYAGRVWKDGVIVDVTNMTEQHLPGIAELAPLLPDTTPDDNRPDPYIVPVQWLENHTLQVSFSWRVKESVNDEDNRIHGEYEYNADTYEFSLMDEAGTS